MGRYNQTHYDHDNPPPKIVQARNALAPQSTGPGSAVASEYSCVRCAGQGYKFNIFYPDLLDKTQSPTYEWPLWPHSRE